MPPDPIALQSKILSLELLLSLLERGGPEIRDSERFVHAVRQYLCVSLLKNCTSSNTQVRRARARAARARSRSTHLAHRRTPPRVSVVFGRARG